MKLYDLTFQALFNMQKSTVSYTRRGMSHIAVQIHLEGQIFVSYQVCHARALPSLRTRARFDGPSRKNTVCPRK